MGFPARFLSAIYILKCLYLGIGMSYQTEAMNAWKFSRTLQCALTGGKTQAKLLGLISEFKKLQGRF
jgi:hypothetical protein